jgi:Domain of unknown function (DUF4105)
MNDQSNSRRHHLPFLAVLLAWFVAICLILWASAALYFDLSPARFPFLTPTLFLIAVAPSTWFAKRRIPRLAVCLVSFLIVLACWLSLKPANDRAWQPNVSQAPWAEISGDRVTIHNFRNCYYRQASDFTCEWLTKTVALSRLRGVDLFMDDWGLHWIQHPIISFRFSTDDRSHDSDDDYIAASIEARYQVDQSYSAIRSFFRQFTLVFVLANERDLIRLRTNYRSGEKVYLYHLTANPDSARQLFLRYLHEANYLHDHPRWFNAATDNCTTNLFAQMEATGYLPPGHGYKNPRYSWWILLNGWVPEMLYRRGTIAGNLPFDELKQRAYINPVANTLNDAPDFSREIRLNRPGFDSVVVPDSSLHPQTPRFDQSLQP